MAKGATLQRAVKTGGQALYTQNLLEKPSKAGVQAPRAAACFLGTGLGCSGVCREKDVDGAAGRGLGNQHKDKLAVFPRSSKES